MKAASKFLLMFMLVGCQATSDSQAKFEMRTPTDINNYHPDKLSTHAEQLLASQLYLARRQQFDASDSPLNQVVSQGLALNFVAATIQPNELFHPTVITDEELNEQLSRLAHKQTISADPMTLGYHLVKRHFLQYPGSRANNTYGLNHQAFARYLSQPQTMSHKPYQFERTAGVEIQQRDKAFDWKGTQYQGLVFLEGWNQQKQVALTFDDGPYTFTEQILDTLDKYQIKASFFWVGFRLHQHKNLVVRAKKAGHTLANHSWDHPHGLALLPEVLWTEQVDKTNQAFEQIIGYKPRFYRPPYGEINEKQIEYIGDTDMKIMMWSIDPKDWNTKQVSQQNIESTVINQRHPEAIILLHDGGISPNTVDALPAIIEDYHQRGYQFVTLEKLLGISDKY